MRACCTKGHFDAQNGGVYKREREYATSRNISNFLVASLDILR